MKFFKDFRFREKYVKWLVSILAYGYLIFHFRYVSTVEFTVPNGLELSFRIIFLTFLVLLLTTANWSIEALKWKHTLSPVYEITYARAMRGIFSGLTVAVLTPNRSGEFLGRIFVVPTRYRIHAISSTIISNIFQLFTTLIFGTIALVVWFWFLQYPIFFSLRTIPRYTLYALFALVVVAAIAYFYRIKLFREYEWGKQINTFLRRFSLRTAFFLLLLSILRYFVFIIQFWIITKIFGLSLSLSQVFLGMALTYFLMALLPVLTLAEPITRTTLAMVFFEYLTTETTAVMISVLWLWVINLVIPSIIGTFIINYTK